MILINWGTETKKVCDASIDNCSNCNHLAPFEVKCEEKKLGLFFVPVAHWNKKYYLVCQNCSAGFPIINNKTNEAIKMFTEAPNHEISSKIYSEIIKLLKDGQYLKNEERISQFASDVKSTLTRNGYREKDIEYVFPIAIRSIFNK